MIEQFLASAEGKTVKMTEVIKRPVAVQAASLTQKGWTLNEDGSIQQETILSDVAGEDNMLFIYGSKIEDGKLINQTSLDGEEFAIFEILGE